MAKEGRFGALFHGRGGNVPRPSERPANAAASAIALRSERHFVLR
jgi:hypothetical protein